MCADVVVVGGGPVGLWTATQLKKRDPLLDVVVYERYAEYQRSHILHLSYRSMVFYAANTRDGDERAFFKALTGNSRADVFSAASGFGAVNIRTNELEDALTRHADALGVRRVLKHIASPEEAEKLHPECNMFVAADGAHSKMREALLGPDGVTNFPLQHVVELKYQAAGKAKPLSPLRQHRLNQKLNHMAFEYVGREKGGTTPVTMRFFLDEATYAAVPDATFKSPLGLGNPAIPETLAQDIATCMEQRRHKGGETYDQGSGRLSKLTLSLYKANEFAVTRGDESQWFIVGDAAMGVPYFRALNAGLIMGSQLAGLLTNDLWNPAQKVSAYNLLVPLDTAWEFTGAAGKNLALEAYNSIRQMTGFMTKGMQDAGILPDSTIIQPAPANDAAARARKKPAPGK